MYTQLSYNISVQTVKARCRMGQGWMVILMKLRLRLVWFWFLSLILDIATILIRNPPTPRFRRPYSLQLIKHVNTIRGWVKSVLFFGLELCVWLVWAILPRNSYLLMCSVIYIYVWVIQSTCLRVFLMLGRFTFCLRSFWKESLLTAKCFEGEYTHSYTTNFHWFGINWVINRACKNSNFL